MTQTRDPKQRSYQDWEQNIKSNPEEKSRRAILESNPGEQCRRAIQESNLARAMQGGIPEEQSRRAIVGEHSRSAIPAE